MRVTSLLLLGTGAGLLIGALRLESIDGGAHRGVPAATIEVRGFVAAVPRRTGGKVRVQLDTVEGRLLAEAREPVPDLAVGAEVRASGVLRLSPPWYRAYLRRHGIARVLEVTRLVPTGRRRGGITGRLDRLRIRAEEALGRGMPAREAALARGFVLGQDDRIDAGTAEAFRRSGLAHLLAVSGQNVVLLVLLASPLLAGLGIPLKARIVWLGLLIALYVPLAGAGPSIQRAGVMGAAALVATLAGRPRSRLYALMVAAAVTLALNPLSSGDVGWQLSFAAVAGIFLWAGSVRDAIGGRLGAGSAARALADGIALTLTATVATAPLMAHHFGALSVTSLAANLLALPAVAPAMWLGMLVAAAGQAPFLPVEPLNDCNALLLAYIAQIAAWLGDPSWALASVGLPGSAGVVAAYGVLLGAGEALRSTLHRRRGLVPPRPRAGRGATLAAAAVAAAAVTVLLVWSTAPGGDRSGGPAALSAGLRVQVLDVGQGDAILLRPADGAPVLVDTGPAEAGLARMLEDSGVRSLAAIVLTHDQADHAGGVAEVLASLPVGRLVYSAAGQGTVQMASAAGAVPVRVYEGGELRSGELRLEVLWPPSMTGPGGPPADPNAASLVLLARWHEFEMLLTGDTEAEVVPIDPGPIDVLKVAHHGSEDAGLEELLDRAAPRIAMLSVGEDNPFGHPAPSTLSALRRHDVRVLRTDRHGSLIIDVGGSTIRAWTDD